MSNRTRSLAALGILVAGAVCAACGGSGRSDQPPTTGAGPGAGGGGNGGDATGSGGAGGMTSGPGTGGGAQACSTAGTLSFESPTTEDVSFTSSSDGITLFGRLYIPEPGSTFATVVMLHQNCGDLTDWQGVSDLAYELSRTGFLVLSYDARGFGQSTDGGSLTLCGETSAVLFEPMVGDLGDAIAFLGTRTEANLDCLGVAGASMGANVSLIYGATDDRVQTVALFSAGLNYLGLSTQNAIEDFDPRESLMFATEDDTYAANSLVTLGDASPAATTVTLSGDEHGAAILDAHPDAMTQTLEWFRDRL